jgi:hypothetical protein
LRTVSEGVASLVTQTGEHAAVGLLAALSEGLPAFDRVRALTVADDGGWSPVPYLAWQLARDVRHTPALLEVADRLDAVAVANLLAGLNRTLPEQEARAAIGGVLSRLAPDTLAQSRVRLTEAYDPDQELIETIESRLTQTAGAR